MKRAYLAGATALALCLVCPPVFAKDLPAGGLSVDDIAKWLQDAGYKAEVQTAKDGSKSVYSAADGTGFYVDFYDCKNGPNCASIQFSVGFDTKGQFNATKMNDWNSNNRWVRAYVDEKDDPWLDMDVDLSPGGTWEGLTDEFAVWRDMLVSFKKFINW
ncbi:MAG TPA: YbjN domain-containing protein [Devosia sp.]|nr:YbjN domain-containing protein [Devosia sp.]